MGFEKDRGWKNGADPANGRCRSRLEGRASVALLKDKG